MQQLESFMTGSSGGWRVEARDALLDVAASWARCPQSDDTSLLVKGMLTRASTIMGASEDKKTRLRNWWSGAPVEETWQAVHRAAALLPLVEPVGALPARLLHVRSRVADLPETDARRSAVVDPQLDGRIGNGTQPDRELLSEALAAAYAASDLKHQAVRSWRNRLLRTAAATLVALCLLLALSAWFPNMMPMCGAGRTCPSGFTGPSGGDVSKVALVGILTGGVIALVLAMRSTEPSASAYRITPALSCLRLALAGLTAVVGVLIVQSGAVPGFTGLSSASQIAFYAIVFGFAQEAVTQILEGRASAVQKAAQPNTAPTP